MDRLTICMDTLRALARHPDDANRVLVAERRINEYLKGEARPALKASLEKLSDAIDREAEPFQGTYHFWIVVQHFVRSKHAFGFGRQTSATGGLRGCEIREGTTMTEKICPECNGEGVVDQDTEDERRCPTSPLAASTAVRTIKVKAVDNSSKKGFGSTERSS
jgi:hypothetical protein